MKLYLTIIGVSITIISVLNAVFGVMPFFWALIGAIWCTALQFLIDGSIAIIINKLPDKWFGTDNRLFNVSEKERGIYKKLKVRLWKDKVWELGGLGGFSKKTLKEPSNPDYIEKFIIECNKGVVTHRLSYAAGFLAMLTFNGIAAYSIAMAVAFVNLFLNILPTLALRYNTPMLKKVLKRLRKKETEKIF